jgi:hypothetical protein
MTGCSWRDRDAATLAMHPTDSNNKLRAFEPFNQLIENETLVVARLGLQVIFENTLRLADGMQSQRRGGGLREDARAPIVA